MSAQRANDRPQRSGSDLPFLAALVALGGAYLLLVIAMLAANASFVRFSDLQEAWARPEIRHATWLSLVTSTITAILSVWCAVPTGYVLARFRFPGKALVDALLDIPIVLPPMVVGLSLLILFQTSAGQAIQRFVPVTYEVPAVVLAQFAVSAAFAIRTTRVAFANLDPRRENVALTLGCTRSQAFWRVVLPEARTGILSAGLLAWARALGEFGPVLVFAGATRMRTEVLPSTVFLELSVGRIEMATAVSLLLVTLAVGVLVAGRLLGLRTTAL